MLRRQAARQFSSLRCVMQEAAKKSDVKPVDNTLINSDETQRIDLEAISGAPADLSRNRIVRIFQESKSATQSGNFQTIPWRINWDVVPRANRWENEMMGWASSGDYMQGTTIKFKSKEDAIRFASNQGWDYYVQEPHKRDFRVKQYAVNFLHSKGPLKHIRTK